MAHASRLGQLRYKKTQYDQLKFCMQQNISMLFIYNLVEIHIILKHKCFIIDLKKETETLDFNSVFEYATYEDMFRYDSHIIFNSNIQLTKTSNFSYYINLKMKVKAGENSHIITT